jgi:ferritin-like metal-binding protein YciE
MNAEQKETYLACLRDAHAMELSLIKALEKQVREMAQMPEARERVQQHIDETRGHAEKVEACITRNGGSVSKTKDLSSKLMASMKNLGSRTTEDSMVKNVLIGYSGEHFEIGSYLIIRSAAEELGDTETVSVCDDILTDEYAMADWIKEQIPVVTTTHIQALAAEESESERSLEEELREADLLEETEEQTRARNE